MQHREGAAAAARAWRSRSAARPSRRATSPSSRLLSAVTCAQVPPAAHASTTPGRAAHFPCRDPAGVRAPGGSPAGMHSRVPGRLSWVQGNVQGRARQRRHQPAMQTHFASRCDGCESRTGQGAPAPALDRARKQRAGGGAGGLGAPRAPARRRSTPSGTCTPASACRSNSAERAGSSACTAATTAADGSYAALMCGLDTASAATSAHATPASSGARSVCARRACAERAAAQTRCRPRRARRARGPQEASVGLTTPTAA